MAVTTEPSTKSQAGSGASAVLAVLAVTQALPFAAFWLVLLKPAEGPSRFLDQVFDVPMGVGPLLVGLIVAGLVWRHMRSWRAAAFAASATWAVAGVLDLVAWMLTAVTVNSGS
ncbi:MAG: hypothetical protein ACHQE5_00835 [Actinomycetes bacterium]